MVEAWAVDVVGQLEHLKGEMKDNPTSKRAKEAVAQYKETPGFRLGWRLGWLYSRPKQGKTLAYQPSKRGDGH
ncbi:hypothetical protein BHM03_00028335 [Ensete ventricosum]|uniref:Uncharacterized protein n=1 Tax=Ensete ventricosum TaxID=4639 RepID=A0A445MHR9_ENSVE|nr:hypothetical protein BHM03_00028335 [Ensete ventricosum]